MVEVLRFLIATSSTIYVELFRHSDTVPITFYAKDCRKSCLRMSSVILWWGKVTFFQVLCKELPLKKGEDKARERGKCGWSKAGKMRSTGAWRKFWNFFCQNSHSDNLEALSPVYIYVQIICRKSKVLRQTPLLKNNWQTESLRGNAVSKSLRARREKIW